MEAEYLRALEMASRGGSVALACLLIFIGWLQYESEEKQFGGKLEEWWISIDDMHKSAMSKQAAFLKSIAALLITFLDRIYGPDLVSVRMFIMSVMLSLSFAFPIALISTAATGHHGGSLLSFIGLFVFSAATLAATIYNAFQPAAFRTIKQMREKKLVVPQLLTILGFVIFIWLTRNEAMLFFLSVFFLGICALDCALVFIARATLLRIQKSGAAVDALVLAASNLILLATILYLMFSVFDLPIQILYVMVYSITICGMYILVGSLAWIHYLIWPTVKRPLYALARFKFFQNRKQLFTITIALFVYGVLGDWQTFQRAKTLFG